MGAAGAVEIVFRNHADKVGMRKEYKEKFTTPLAAAKRGYLDDIIRPRYFKKRKKKKKKKITFFIIKYYRETRTKLIEQLEMLKTKSSQNPWKKHGCIPL
jgi:propionyl-CoA carboxylase beta chain